ncbi:hypothetical protein G6F68_015930 [Rhizopus microsporus]|nr:hypothetical protein G6F68_015930 [Rhizopus microsporus]
MHVECKEVVHHLGESGHAGSHEMGLVDGQADFQATHHRGELAAVHPGGHRRLLQLEDAVDVGLLGFQVDAGRTLALAALVQRGHRRILGLQPRHDALTPMPPENFDSWAMSPYLE